MLDRLRLCTTKTIENEDYCLNQKASLVRTSLVKFLAYTVEILLSFDMTTISSPQDTGRSPHDFGTHGVQDLRAFLRACRLPHTGIFDALKPYAGLAPNPAMLIRSRANHALQVRPEAWRRLEDISLISSSCDLKQTANQCMFIDDLDP